MEIINTIDLTKWGFFISAFGTFFGFIGLIISSISLYRVGTIQKVVEYNDTVEEYNKNLADILNRFLNFEKEFEKKVSQFENEQKQIVDYDLSLFSEFSKIKDSLQRYQSIDEVQKVLMVCKEINVLLTEKDILKNKIEQDQLLTKLDKIKHILSKKGARKDGK